MLQSGRKQLPQLATAWQLMMPRRRPHMQRVRAVGAEAHTRYATSRATHMCRAPNVSRGRYAVYTHMRCTHMQCARKQCAHMQCMHRKCTHAVYRHAVMVLMGAGEPPIWLQSACHHQALATRGHGPSLFIQGVNMSM